MFENSNKGIVKEIADETMKVHRLRNIMACFAIMLTAVLITIICGAGISTVRAIQTERSMNPGPGSGGAGIEGGHQVLEKIREQPEVEWAEIARPCSQGTPRNREFAGLNLKFLGVSDGYYGHNYVDLICGEYPKNAQQILMSDTLAERIGKKIEPGQKMTLNLVSVVNGEKVEKPAEVTICGFYKNPLKSIENYEEVYTTEDAQDIYNAELKDASTKIYTKISGITSSTPSSEVKEKLEELNEKTGGAGVFYIMNAGFEIVVYLGAAAILLLIIVCGYFLIYNIFYISIVNDIRFIGNMKTIGMTGRQVRTMLGYQVRRLALIGTLTGVAAGTLINVFVVTTFRNLQYTFSQFYDTKISLVLAVPAAVVFTAVTVWISSRKALKLASGVSPVEASRFRTSGHKKTIFAVVSFAVSGILFCVLYTAMMGYNIEYMVNRMNESDFRIFQYHAIQYMEEPYEPMESGLQQKVDELKFVDKSYAYYAARDLSETSDTGSHLESSGKVKYDGKFREIIEKEFGNAGIKSYDIVTDGDCQTGIMGMEAEALPMEAENLDIFSGELDAGKFATGDYIIYQPFDGWGKGEDYQYDAVRAGEQIELSFFNYERQEYVSKTFTVLAVVGNKADNYAGEFTSSVQIILNNSTFREIYGNDTDKLLSSIRIETSGENEKEEQEILEQLAAETFNTQVQVTSKYKTRMSEQTQKMQKTILGIFVGLVFGFIGMANIVNTLVTGVLSRKIEFAAMQSIGMTKRQMAEMIFKDGLKMIAISLLIMIPVGIPVGMAVAGMPLSTGFVPRIYGISICMTAAAGVILTLAVAAVLTGSLNKKAVVERLREAE